MVLSKQIAGFFNHRYMQENQLGSYIFGITIVINERKLLSIPILDGCGQACPAMPKLGNTCHRSIWVIPVPAS